MHSPEVVVFDIHAPIPIFGHRFHTDPTWGFAVHRRTNKENLGERVYPWYRPEGYELFAFGKPIKMYRVGTLWHYEPDDADALTVCEGMQGTNLSWGNIKWAWKHREHLEFHWNTYRRVHGWLTLRCAACGRPFRWKEGKIGEWSGDNVWHEPCHRAEWQKRQIETLLDYIEGDRSFRSRYSVERMLENRRERAEERAEESA